MSIQASDEIIKIIRDQHAFSNMDDATINAIASCAVIGKFKLNQYLWKFGDQGDHCTIILSGLIEIIRPTGVEEDTCMGIFGKGDVVGLSALLNKNTFPGSAKVLDNTRTLKIFLGTLNESNSDLNTRQEINNWMKEKILAHEHVLREKIDIISAGTIENRLRELFRHLLRRFGSIQAGCKYEIDIKLSKSKAAKLMGIRNETAIRLINGWQKRNLINWDEDKIIIHDLEMIDRFIMQQRAK